MDYRAGVLSGTVRQPAVRGLSAALTLALVAGLFEVTVRSASPTAPTDLNQVALALSSNIGLLGLTAAIAAAICWTALSLTARIVARPALRAAAFLDPFAIGCVVLVLLIQTKLLGWGDSFAAWQCILVSLASAFLFALARWLCRQNPTRIGTLAQAGAVLVWLGCLAATADAVVRTNDHVNAWLKMDETVQACEDQTTPNLVLVVMDTVRADRVGVYGGRDLTPHLDQLAESSIVYTRAFSTAPWTLPAHASLFTGLYPGTHGVNWGHYRLDERAPSLAELIKERGYDTFAISNNWLLNESNGFARGFDSFIEITKDPMLSRWKLALQCGAVQSAAGRLGLSPDVSCDTGSSWTNWLLRKRTEDQARSNRPFFAFINYFEPHDPYLPPDRYLRKKLTPQQRTAYLGLHQNHELLAAHACGLPGIFDDNAIALLAALYDAEVAYQDEIFGELITVLQDQKLLDNTWIVVTSDHGELFGEHNMVYHTAGSHYKLLHVPLIVRPSGGVIGRESTAPVQLVDIFVTLLQVAGATVPASVDRAYPLPLGRDDPAQREICVAETHGASIAGLSIAQRMDMQADLAHWLTWVTSVYDDGYVLEVDERGPRALFDVETDPDMNNNLVDRDGQKVRAILASFQNWKQGYSEEKQYGSEIDARSGDPLPARHGLAAGIGPQTGRGLR